MEPLSEYCIILSDSQSLCHCPLTVQVSCMQRECQTSLSWVTALPDCFPLAMTKEKLLCVSTIRVRYLIEKVIVRSKHMNIVNSDH